MPWSWCHATHYTCWSVPPVFTLVVGVCAPSPPSSERLETSFLCTLRPSSTRCMKTAWCASLCAPLPSACTKVRAMAAFLAWLGRGDVCSHGLILHCSRLAVHCSLFTVHRSSFIVHCSPVNDAPMRRYLLMGKHASHLNNVVWYMAQDCYKFDRALRRVRLVFVWLRRCACTRVARCLGLLCFDVVVPRCYCLFVQCEVHHAVGRAAS